MQIHSAIKKLRNARFDPPNGGPREKLRWINDGEADLLRRIGGSGKKGKFGLESFWLGDHANSLGSAGASNWAGNGKGGQVNLDNVGGSTGNVLRNVYGEWKVVSKNPQPQQAAISRAPVVKPPVIAPPVMAPIAAVPKPMAKPAAPIALDPQIAGRLQAAMAPKPTVTSSFPARPSVISSNVARAPTPSISPQNFGFAAPARAPTQVSRAPMTRAAEIRTDRMTPSGFQPSSFREAAVRSDRAPTAPGAGVRAVPEGPRTDRMATSQNFTSMAAEAAARAAANRSRVPAGAIPTPRQNPLRDTSKIRTDNTFNAATDFGMIDGPALSRLAALQDRFGKPITVTEGAALGHVAKSQHHVNPLTGKANAMDLSVATGDRAALARLANEVGFGGIGAYNNFPNMVHVDTGKKRSWGPNGKAKNIGQLRDRALQTALRDRAARTAQSYADLGDE